MCTITNQEIESVDLTGWFLGGARMTTTGGKVLDGPRGCLENVKPGDTVSTISSIPFARAAWKPDGSSTCRTVCPTRMAGKCLQHRVFLKNQLGWKIGTELPVYPQAYSKLAPAV